MELEMPWYGTQEIKVVPNRKRIDIITSLKIGKDDSELFRHPTELTTPQAEVIVKVYRKVLAKEIGEGLERLNGRIKRYSVIGNKVELVSKNGFLYFGIPHPEEYDVTFNKDGTSAHLNARSDDHRFSGYFLYAFRIDERDVIKGKLFPEGRAFDLYNENFKRFGELNLVQAVITYQLFPEQVYLTEHGIERKRKVDSGRYSRKELGLVTVGTQSPLELRLEE